KHAASYAGLVPATYHSGDREAYGRITKRGSGELRAMLCEAAHHGSRPTRPLHPYFALRCAKRGYKIATSAVRPPTGPDHGCHAARRHGLRRRQFPTESGEEDALRRHARTQRRPPEHFDAVEQGLLLPAPATP